MNDYYKNNEILDKIYQKIPVDKIPWAVEESPDSIKYLVENKIITPCNIIDLGCGTGTISIYLAKNGFNVTGVDVSPAAVKIAKANAQKNNVNCTFIVQDLISDWTNINKKYDFILEWALLHYIYPEERDNYLNKVNNILNKNGRYLALCFSDQDEILIDKNSKYLNLAGNKLYFSSNNELEKLYRKYFNVIDLKIIDIKSNIFTHKMNYALLEKL